jgi:hypothetical protein
MQMVATGGVPSFPPGYLSRLFLFVGISFVLGAMANAAAVVIVSDSYLGREVTIANAVERVIERLGAILMAAILQSFVVFVGFIFFFIPGLLALGWFFATVNVVMIEGRDAISALGRSRQLTRGSLARVLGIMLLAGIVFLIVYLVFAALLTVGLSALAVGPEARGAVAGLIRVLIYPFFTVLMTLLYYDLRIRKEGFDLEVMAKELAGAAPTAVPA